MFNQFNSDEFAGQTEPDAMRFSEQAQQQIIALALQLQNQQQGTVSAIELEAAASEIGLEPHFIRQAITQFGKQKVAVPHLKKPAIPLKWTSDFWYGCMNDWSRKDIGVAGGAFALAVFSGLGRLSGVIAFAYIGFLLAAMLGLLLGPKKNIFWLGVAILATELATVGWGSHLHLIGRDTIHIFPSDWLVYPGIAGIASLVGTALRWLFAHKPSLSPSSATK